MGILLAYFAFIASTLAVIMMAWVGVAESGVDRLHLQRASTIQQSYDASFMAADRSNTELATKTKTPQVAANTRAPHRRAHVASRLEPHVAPRPGPALDLPLGAVALRGMPPPNDGY